MLIGRDEILQLIPHAGSMCLHDQVLEYTPERIRCRAANHRDSKHPLRRDGVLHALHLAEYGAQAMAVHGGLLARARGERAPPGFLAVVRDLKLGVTRLDDLPDAIETEARMLMGGAEGWTYEFSAASGGRTLGSGRVTVMLVPAMAWPGSSNRDVLNP